MDFCLKFLLTVYMFFFFFFFFFFLLLKSCQCRHSYDPCVLGFGRRLGTVPIGWTWCRLIGRGFLHLSILL